MPVNDIIAKRKQLQGIEDEGDDFTVGTISGLEDNNIASIVKELNEEPTTTKESVQTMTTTIENNSLEVTPELLEGTVSLKTRNEDLAELIAQTNEDVIVQNIGGHFQLNAKQIRVTRHDVERKLGKMDDGRWRMLFVNRGGDIHIFNDYDFVLGVVEAEVEEQKEQAQLNTRILAEAKMEMDKTRKLLEMTQAQFLEVAIKSYADKVRAEMI